MLKNIIFNQRNSITFNFYKKIVKRFLKLKLIYFVFNKKKPISALYGLDRGSAIDRFYIEKFLFDNRQSIKGRCLELLNNNYTFKFGENIEHSDVLDIDRNNKNANIFGDIRNLDGVIEDNVYDCIILTQVLQFIDNYESAINECRRILKPGGSLLITVPFISRIDCQSGVSGDFWRFSTASMNYIFKKIFEDYIVSSFGNTLTGLGFWIGLAQEDLCKKDFNFNDENFPCIITVTAKK